MIYALQAYQSTFSGALNGATKSQSAGLKWVSFTLLSTP